LHDAVDDETEELFHGPVFDQLARQHRERLQPRNVFLFGLVRNVVDRDGDGGADARLGDGDETIRAALRSLEDDFRIAEADAVAGLDLFVALDAGAVEVRAVRAAEVLEDPRIALGCDDLRVLAREVTVFDGDGAIGRAADRDRGPLQGLAEGREKRRVDSYFRSGRGRFHSKGAP